MDVQSEKERLIIHTAKGPVQETEEKKTGKKVKWRVLPRKPRRHARAAGRERRGPVTPGEKLLRNTAVCCTLLMGVMALSSLNVPWARQVVQTVSGAVTMDMNLDETLGRLNFVRNWMPDTALVFWNMGDQESLARPVAGALTHEWSEGQPWLEYQVKGEQPVYAAAGGRIAALSENDRGEWTLLIDHDIQGQQSVYGYVAKPIVTAGQQVARGDQIGLTQPSDTARLYYELRVQGAAVDPASRMMGS